MNQRFSLFRKDSEPSLELESAASAKTVQTAMPQSRSTSPEKRSSNGAFQIRRVSGTRLSLIRFRDRFGPGPRPINFVNGSFFGVSGKRFEFRGTRRRPGLIHLPLKTSIAVAPRECLQPGGQSGISKSDRIASQLHIIRRWRKCHKRTMFSKRAANASERITVRVRRRAFKD